MSKQECPNAENLDVECLCHDCNLPYEERQFDPSWLIELGNVDPAMFKEAIVALIDAMRDEARQVERERIIKILKDIEGHDWIEIQFDKLIALIKEKAE